MGTNHTPGPWHVMNTSDVFTGLAALTADGRSTAKDDGWHIADCAPGGSYVEGGSGLHELSHDEIKANARLIAAAPEMYEALKRLLKGGNEDAIGWRGRSGTETLFACEFCKAKHENCAQILHTDSCEVTQARAAIAKAEGK